MSLRDQMSQSPLGTKVMCATIFLMYCNVISIPAIRSELRRQMHIPVKLSGVNRSVVTYAMVDSGASATFLSSRFVERNRVRTEPLPKPIALTNADGSKNSVGMVTRVAPIGLTVGLHQEGIRAFIADLGSEDMIIGVDWLRYHNPAIDWRAGEVDLSRCATSCGPSEPVLEQYPQQARVDHRVPTNSA